MFDIFQIVLFLLVAGYAAVRLRLAPIAGTALLLCANTGIGVSVAATFGAPSVDGPRYVCWAVVAVLLVAIVEKRSLMLERQVTILARHSLR